LLFALATAQAFRRAFRSNQQAPGTVIEIRESIDEDYGKEYLSIVRFEFSGTEYLASDESPSSTITHALGEKVTVYFPPGRPEQAMIGRWRETYFFTLLLVIGLIGLIATSYFEVDR
jgi:hypothetical protein